MARDSTLESHVAGIKIGAMAMVVFRDSSKFMHVNGKVFCLCGPRVEASNSLQLSQLLETLAFLTMWSFPSLS